MLSLYSGTPGSGKSFHALELALTWCKRGKHVIANFPIQPPKKYYSKFHKNQWEKILSRWHFREEISVDYLMALSFENEWFGKESSCMVVIDEAGVIFNSRDWQHERQSRTAWIKFLSQHRKFGYDLIFIAQMDRMIDRQIRGLFEYEVKHLKANNSFFFKWLGMFKISLFMCVYKWYQTKLKGNMRFVFYRPWIAARYDTMKVFNLEELIDAMQKIYEGKVIPAAVAVQLQVWKEELETKEIRKELEKKQVQEMLS